MPDAWKLSPVERIPAGHIAYIGYVTWMEYPLDEVGFASTARQRVTVVGNKQNRIFARLLDRWS
jgi:hypothetical protein